MAYSTPVARTAGDFPPVSDWNNYVRANFIAYETHAHTGASSDGAGTLTVAVGGGPAAPTYTFVGRTSNGMYSSSANAIALATAGIAAFTIDGGQRASIPLAAANALFVGGATTSGTSLVEFTRVAPAQDQNIHLLAVGRSATAANRPVIGFAKSPNLTVGAFTAVASGEALGDIVFHGDDGVALTFATAPIRLQGKAAEAFTGTTHGGQFVVRTTTIGTSSTQADRLTIDSSQFLVAPAATFTAAATFSSSAKSTSPTAGIGYATGAGGTVVQATSKSTAFTLSTICGTITMNGAALAAATTVSATWTNTAIAAGDVVNIWHDSVGTIGAYVINVTPGAGTATLNVRNVHTASLSEAIVLRFAIMKAVTA